MTIEERAAELAADVDADEAAIREDLENLVAYRVPMDEAIQSLRRKYGGTGEQRLEATWTEIGAIDVTDDAVSVTARVLSAGRRSIRFDGEERVITEGEFADETGRISYTAWNDFDLTAGQTVSVENAGVREWDGDPELNLAAQTAVRAAEEPVDVPFEIGGVRELVDLEPGDRDVTIEVYILEIEERTIDGRDGETVIRSGVMGDGSGRLPFTDWKARQALETGVSIRVENAYVREFRGLPSINLSEYSRVSTLDRAVDVAESGTRRSIAEAIDAGAIYDVEILGNVVDVREGSGLIERCPECHRVIRMGECRSHGEVEGVEDMRVKAVIDDGTGAATAILGSSLTEHVYGKDIDAALAEAREAMDQAVIGKQISKLIVGRPFRVRGRFSVDEYGANIEANAFEAAVGDPSERAGELLAAIEGEP